MAVIFLKHSVHGAKVAISKQEAMNDKANGWVEFDPTVKTSEVVESNPTEVPDFLKAVVAQKPVRRGRKPKGE